jgi:hypothetical protein
MPNEPEPPSPLEHSGERVALGPRAEPELGDGNEDAQQGPPTGTGQVAIDPKLGDGDAVTHGKMKGMLQDPGLVAAMSEAARGGPRDTERQLRGPRKPFFLNTQQFHNACDLAGVKEAVAVRGAPDAVPAEVGAAAKAERHEPLEGAEPERPSSEPRDETTATHRSEVRRRRGLLLVLGLGGAALLVAILVMAWPSEPSADPPRLGVPESGTGAVPTERVASTAGKGAGGSEPASSNATSGAATGASPGSATAPAVTTSARASGTGSTARSAGPPSGATTHAPAPTAVPSVTSSLPFPLEGAK